MDDDLPWDLEARFWTDGADFARATAMPEAVMVFPDPVGILTGEAIFAGFDGAPRWSRVDMDHRTVRRHGATAILAYRARADRDGDPTYHALCASTWVRDGAEWRMLGHQQTPAEGPET